MVQEDNTGESLSGNPSNMNRNKSILQKLLQVSRPNSRNVAKWDILQFVTATVACFILPYQSAYIRTLGGVWLTVYILDALLALDIFVSSRRGYRHRGVEVMKRKLVWNRYLKTHFVVDIMCVLPLESIGLAAGLSQAEAVLMKWVRVLFLMFKLKRISSNLEEFIKLYQFVLLVKYLLVIVLVPHVMACIVRNMLSRHTGRAPATFLDPRPLEGMYIDDLYWAVYTFTQCGFGDRVPNDSGDMFVMSVLMIMCKMLIGLVLGVFAVFIAHADSFIERYRSKMRMLADYMEDKKLPCAIRLRVNKYYEYIWSQQEGIRTSSLISVLPDAIATDISMELIHSNLLKVPAFKDLPRTGFLRMLSTKFHSILCLPDEELVRTGDVSQEFFIVASGILNKISKGRLELKMGQGAFFGELNLFVDIPSDMQVITKTHAHVYVLQKSDFNEVMESFIGARKTMQASGKERYAKVKTMKDRIYSFDTEFSHQASPEQFVPENRMRSVSTFSKVVGRVMTMIKAQRKFKISPSDLDLSICEDEWGCQKPMEQTQSVPMENLRKTSTGTDAGIVPLRFGTVEEDSEDIEEIEALSVLQWLWRKCLAAVIVINAFILPSMAALDSTMVFGWVFTYFVDLTMILDVVLNYFVFKTTRIKISLAAVSDVIMLLPLELGALITVPGVPWARMFALLRFNRLLQCRRIIVVFTKMENNLENNMARIRYQKIVLFLAIISHFMSCIWMIFRPDEDYSTAFYFVMVTTSLTGYGEITSNTVYEHVFVIVLQYIGVVLLGFFLGYITSALANAEYQITMFKDKLWSIKRMLMIQKVEPCLSERINNYYHYIWDRNHGVDSKELLKDLPLSILSEVCLAVNQDVVEKVPLFAGTEIGFIRMVCMALEQVLFLEKEYVIRKGDIGAEMFFIYRGTVEVVSPDGAIVFATMDQGAFFGEIALMFKCPRTASIRCRTKCDLYVLRKEELDEILLKFPLIKNQVHESAAERMKAVKARSAPSNDSDKDADKAKEGDTEKKKAAEQKDTQQESEEAAEDEGSAAEGAANDKPEPPAASKAGDAAPKDTKSVPDLQVGDKPGPSKGYPSSPLNSLSTSASEEMDRTSGPIRLSPIDSRAQSARSIVHRVGSDPIVIQPIQTKASNVKIAKPKDGKVPPSPRSASPRATSPRTARNTSLPRSRPTSRASDSEESHPVLPQSDSDLDSGEDSEVAAESPLLPRKPRQPAAPSSPTKKENAEQDSPKERPTEKPAVTKEEVKPPASTKVEVEGAADTAKARKRWWSRILQPREPDSAFAQRHDTFQAFIGVASIMIIPLHAAFFSSDLTFWIVTYLIDALMAVNIFCNFQLIPIGTEPPHTLTTTARAYLKGLFVLDLFSVIPFELAVLGIVSGEYQLQIMAYTRLTRVMGFYRTLSYFSHKETLLGSNVWFNRMLKFCVWIATSTHVAACLWFAVACNFAGARDECRPNTWGDFALTIESGANVSMVDVNATTDHHEVSRGHQYMSSLYWTSATMTTTGYGDIHAHVTEEYIVSVLVMLIGSVVYSFVIGGIMATLANSRSQRMQFEDNLSTVTTFLRDHSIRERVIQGVTDYYDYVWNCNNGTDAQQLLKELPETMKTELALFSSKEIITKLPLFKNGSSGFYALVARALRTILFMPGQCVVRKDDVGTNMFFLVKGTCEVVNEDNRSILTLQEGTFFGEIAIILGARRTATIRAKERCEMFQLNKSDFDNILEACPEMKPQCRMKAEEKKKKKPGVTSRKSSVSTSSTHHKRGQLRSNNAMGLGDRLSDEVEDEGVENKDSTTITKVANFLSSRGSRAFRGPRAKVLEEDVQTLTDQDIASFMSSKDSPSKSSESCGSEHPLKTYLQKERRFELENIDHTPRLKKYLCELFSTRIIDSSSGSLYMWNALIILITSLDGILLPIHAFVDTNNVVLWILPYVGCIILIFDIFVRSRVAMPEDQSERTRIESREEVAKAYLKSMFCLHLISTLPFELFLLPFGHYQIAAIMRLLRCLRMFQIPSLFNFYTKRLGTNIILVETVKFITELLIVNVWLGCIWYTSACFSDTCKDESTWIKVYDAIYTTPFEDLTPGSGTISSLYWASATITSSGYGDIRALKTNTYEYLVSVVGMISGIILFGFMTSMIASLISHDDLKKLSYIHKLELTKKWMRDHHLTDTIASRVEGFYCYMWSHSHGIDEPHILLSRLPRTVEAEISVLMNKDIMLKVDLFRFADIGFLRSLALCIKPVVFFPGDTIVREGDIGSSMYFISTGEVIVSTEGLGNICVLEAGSFFGEISLFHNIRRTATIRAQGVCEAMMVRQIEFNKLLTHYPRMKKIMNGIAERRFSQLQEDLDPEGVKDTKPHHKASNPYLQEMVNRRKSLNTVVVSENDCVPILYPGEFIDFVLNPNDIETIEEFKEREGKKRNSSSRRIDDLTTCEGGSQANSTLSINRLEDDDESFPDCGRALSASVKRPWDGEKNHGIPSITRLTQSRLSGDAMNRKDSTVSLTVSMHGSNGEEMTSDFTASTRAFKPLPVSSKSNMVYSSRSHTLDVTTSSSGDSGAGGGIRAQPDLDKEKNE